MNNRKKLGFILIFLGFVMALTGKVITGSVVGLQGQNYLGTIGVFIFIVGAFLIVTSKMGGLEENLGGGVRVYDADPYGKTNIPEDEKWYMRDSPESLFSAGDINLKDFKILYDEIKGNKELEDWAKDFYGPRLVSIIREGKATDSRAALEFLKIFYGGKTPENLDYGLGNEENELEENRAQQYLSQGKIPEKSRELINLAQDMGYITSEEGRREGTIIRKTNGDILTVIPRHQISRGVSRGVLKAFATGESSFRQGQRKSAEKKRKAA